MKDQIVDTNGQPVAAPAPEYVEEFDNSFFPVQQTGGRMYLGLSKPELIAAQLFAQHFNPADIDAPETVSRLAHRCVAGAKILLAAARAKP